VHGRNHEITSPATLGSKTVFLEIVGDDVYQMSRLLHKLPGNPNVVDLGANFGLVASWIRLLRPDSHVVAFDPNPSVDSFLRENGRRFGFETHSTAISDKQGTTALSIGCDTTLAHVTARGLHGQRTVEVSAVDPQGLLELCGGHIHLLKCDCEGGEKWLLQDPQFLAAVDRITMEYHSDTITADEATRVLVLAGFNVIHGSRGSDSGHLIALKRSGTLSSGVRKRK
jgi:FkbM family methyltransferase